MTTQSRTRLGVAASALFLVGLAGGARPAGAAAPAATILPVAGGLHDVRWGGGPHGGGFGWGHGPYHRGFGWRPFPAYHPYYRPYWRPYYPRPYAYYRPYPVYRPYW